MSAPSDQRTADLVKQASQQITDLVRAEMRMAAAEVKEKSAHAGKGAGLMGGAGLVAGYGVAALLAAAIAALALVLPVWAAALIVAAVLLAVAAVLALMGRRETARAVPPTPDRAIDSTKEDFAEIRKRARR
jgi:nitrate/nitrite transporter NarK